MSAEKIRAVEETKAALQEDAGNVSPAQQKLIDNLKEVYLLTEAQVEELLGLKCMDRWNQDQIKGAQLKFSVFKDEAAHGKYFAVRMPDAAGENGPQVIPITANGVSGRYKCGSLVVLRGCQVAALDNATRGKMEIREVSPGVKRSVLVGTTKRFPYVMLGEISRDDFMKINAKCHQKDVDEKEMMAAVKRLQSHGQAKA